MGQESRQNALRKTRRYIIVSIVGTHQDALDVADDIDDCGRSTLNDLKESIHVFGCDGCGCQSYFPTEESCEDELCGHNCEACGCFRNCVECGNEVGNNEDYCSSKCRIQGTTF